MKYLYLLCLLLCFGSANAQQIPNYHPFLNCSSRYYILMAAFSGGNYCWLIEKGDTIINSITYRQIVVADTFGNYSQTVKWVREDTALQKLFLFDTLSNSDKLMVNFTVSVGDTAEIYVDSSCQNIFTKAIVTQIDYIDSTSQFKFNGTGKRKLISYHNLYSPIIQYQYCEEIGNLDYQNPFDYAYNCYQEGNLVLLSTFHNRSLSLKCYVIFSFPIPDPIPYHVIDGCIPTKYSYPNKKICNTDSVFFHNKHIRATGIYIDTLHLVQYDSIIRLNLLVLPKVYTVQKTFHICSGVSSVWSDTIYNSLGCDSIYKIKYYQLSSGTIQHKNDTLFICKGVSYSSLDTIQNRWGCDSTIINYWHKLNVIDTTINQRADTLIANYHSNYTYQWINCNHGFIESNNNILVVKNSDYYFLIITDVLSNCSDTINCFGISGTDMFYHLSKLSIHPNPSSTSVSIISPVFINSFEVIDVIGRVVNSKSKIQNQNEIQLNITDLPQGIYFIKTIDKSGDINIGKFVKN